MAGGLRVSLQWLLLNVAFMALPLRGIRARCGDPDQQHARASPHLRDVIQSAHNAARTALGTASLHQKQQFDRNTSGAAFQICDLVMYLNPIPPYGTSAKFNYSRRGSFVVLDTVAPSTLLCPDAFFPDSPPFTANFSKLKPYRGHLPRVRSKWFNCAPTSPSVEISVGEFMIASHAFAPSRDTAYYISSKELVTSAV
ncbi:unnamed protein product [Schistocephalus solidus]|uniref:SCP domain-containing protein n=1 Tax=Schistocephalus solidus TaxID=70667 RepID=A0A183TSQ4_SCHSO|nr:unnamed protein product [Schistocephalus solidus]